ncbi:alpha/beta hydrolase [Arthrobacter sp.]|uniref:alpha/beta hydrolase n=1 Tax=Arthrobacter sp. TaxID=1667 RepID=UPI002810B9FF|nr:alpha/beta hydrolase [Arthrobacter sp.]
MFVLKSLGIATSLAMAAAPAGAAFEQLPAATLHGGTGAGGTVTGGTLPSGAQWAAEVPADWNGAVVLYSHGFRPGPANPAWDGGFEPTADALMDRGYAVASSSYATAGWALETAVEDQLGTLEAFSEEVATPTRTIAFGTSMGGLVSSLIAEAPDSGVDGVVSTCGLLGGGVNLNNYQLDGLHALAQLLLPGQEVQLTGFRTGAESGVTINKLNAAVQQAQQTPEGRARIALSAAFMNTPTWFTGTAAPGSKDYQAQQAAQYNWLLGTIPFVVGARASIVNAANGDSGWNAGVDYGRLFQHSAMKAQVDSLYREAALDLSADLSLLTQSADIEPDAGALEWMQRTSIPQGDLQVPVLTMHTLADILAPVEYMEEYAETVRGAQAGPLLRQTYVERTGHCSFTIAETVAAVETMNERLDDGHWGNLAKAAVIDQRGESLGLGEADFIQYRPDEFINDRS